MLVVDLHEKTKKQEYILCMENSSAEVTFIFFFFIFFFVVSYTCTKWVLNPRSHPAPFLWEEEVQSEPKHIGFQISRYMNRDRFYAERYW